MSHFNYSLNDADYSWNNALLWGNFIGHCKKANEDLNKIKEELIKL
jgi:hypothetical protein